MAAPSARPTRTASTALKAGTDIDYDGASGPVDLTASHEPNVGNYDVWQYDAEGAPGNVPDVPQIKIEE